MIAEQHRALVPNLSSNQLSGDPETESEIVGQYELRTTEKNVLGVIALGQGLVNVTEGYRLLKENTKLATAAQRIMNTVAKANPYVLLATALVAAGAALIIWKMNGFMEIF